jgi:hypothetical protein
MTENLDVHDWFNDLTLDAVPDADGDDSLAVDDEQRTPIQTFPAVPTAAPPAQKIVVVPYNPVHPGDVGDHVFAVKRANARYRGGGRLIALEAKAAKTKRTWAKTTSKQSFSADFRQTQKMLGVPVTGWYDRPTHSKLAPWFDAYAISLMMPPKTDPRIARQLGWHAAVYNRRWRVAYSQARPSQLRAAEELTRADCSGSVAGGCDWAGILPAVDWRWTNTWSQVELGTSVAGVTSAKPGDVFFYGSGTSHEALYVGERLVWSFGSYPCKILPYDYRHDRVAIRRFVT